MVSVRDTSRVAVSPAFRTLARARPYLHENVTPPQQGASATAGDERGKGANEQANTNGDGGLDWLTKAATGSSKPSTTTPAQAAAPSAAPAVDGSCAEEDDWLAVAKSTGQTKRKSHNSPAAGSSVAVASAAPGGWMSSGKLGLPTGDGSDEDDAGKTGGGSAKAKKKKQTRRASLSAGGPPGWLGSGALGVPAGGESDEDDVGGGVGGGSGDARGVGVTIETQTDENIEAVTKGETVQKENAPKLPPWAKPWVPPPKPEVVPDAAPEVTSAPTEETGKQVMKALSLIIVAGKIPKTESTPKCRPSALCKSTSTY